ncbi:hypothetical protein P7K49_000523 [Saguinus oedipus]|uniref:Uncharacterized protein n=1 Tax=Saguinus oedipus TaxID=9490 RepID=A0ABQ9WFK1_SAGOE|nr:hypothetical protein P7K49_000523 [Saguinus oedipus]
MVQVSISGNPWPCPPPPAAGIPGPDVTMVPNLGGRRRSYRVMETSAQTHPGCYSGPRARDPTLWAWAKEAQILGWGEVPWATPRLSETGPAASHAFCCTCHLEMAFSSMVATPDPARFLQQRGPKGQTLLRHLNQAPQQEEDWNWRPAPSQWL